METRTQPMETSDVAPVSADGTVLHATWWKDPTRPPRAVALLVHGIHQSAHLYRPDGCSTLVSRLLQEAECDVLAVDLRGFGCSSGSYNVRSYASFEADVLAALELAAAHAHAHAAKVVYFGHSLGGLVGAHLATSASPPPRIDAYVLSAPTVKVHASAVERLVVRLCARVLPCVPLARMVVRGPMGCTNNEQFAAEMLAATPALPFPARYLAAGVEAIDETRKRSAQFHRPLLVLTGPPPAPKSAGAGAAKMKAGARTASSSAGACAHDVHFAGPDELVAVVAAAGKVTARLCLLPAPAPHDLVFEPQEPNPAVEATVEFVRDVGARSRAVPP